MYPQKPDAVRYAIVSLYGAACINLSFLIMNGDVQWFEHAGEPFSMLRLALLHMAGMCVIDAGCGWAISRYKGWAGVLFMICFCVGIPFHMFTMRECIIHSPGLFIIRIMTLLMELAAIFLLLRPQARTWFAALPTPWKNS